MDWPLVIITSFNMAIDASVTNACNAVRTGLKKWGLLLLAAFFFGLFQAAMPTIGYFVGYAFREVLETYIPYIAFALLTLLAIKSFVDFIKELRSSEEERGGELRFREILFQAVATSIDALCIGFTFLSYSIPEALIVFSCIGGITFAVSFGCALLGSILSRPLKRYAGLISALVFFGIGLKIILEAIL